MENNEIRGMEEAEKKLYSPEPGNLEVKRGRLSERRYDAKGDWGNNEFNIGDMSHTKKSSFPLLRFIFILSALFFVIAVGFAFYLYMGGTNTVTPGNVDISLSGPVSVKGGEEFNLQVVITNKNNIALEYADLIVTFPQGSMIATNKVNDTQYRKSLGTIKSNEAISETVKAAFFGEENGEKEITVAIEYRNEGSNAIIEKSSTWKTVISSSPLSLIFDVPSDANSNQDIVLNTKVISNSKETLTGVLLNVAYPAGFIFKSATPAPLSGNSIFDIGTLKQGQEKLIKITGTIQGQNEEQKTFRASAGMRANRDSNKVDVVYASSVKTLALTKPFIGLDLALDGSSDEIFISNDGMTVRGDIEWMNNLPVDLLHSTLTLKLSGAALDKTSVSAGTGFYKSAENTIIWDKTTKSLADLIEPGQGGRLTFSLSNISLLSSRQSILKNPEIRLNLTMRGVRSAEDGSEGTFVETTVSKTIKVSSNMQIAPRALYYSGPFKNTGELPPIRDKETTYTIVWSVVNSSNDVSGVTAKAVLPPYARWIGVSSPQSEKISYSPLGGEIVWNVGAVKAGSGVTLPAREVAFQIGITPSLSQIGSYPNLLGETTLSGLDEFTDETITYERRPITIQLTADPLVQGAENGVIK